MKFKRQARVEADINLAPMIDVVFILLIFFVVSTTFTKESHLVIDLPEASAQPSEQPQQALEILITSTGEYSVNGNKLIDQKLTTLMRALKQEMAGQAKAPTVITADAKTPHEAVVRAMDAAGQLGLVNISISTRQPEQENN